MCPVRMIRCRLVAPIPFRTIKVPIVNRNGFGANRGHALRNTRTRAATGQITLRGTANAWLSPAITVLDTLIVSLRRPEQPPGAQDQQSDHGSKGYEGGDRGAVVSGQETLTEAEDDAAEGRTRDTAHAAQDHDHEGHHQWPVAHERRESVSLSVDAARQSGHEDRNEEGELVDQPRPDALSLGDLDVLRSGPHGEPVPTAAHEGPEGEQDDGSDRHNEKPVRGNDQVAEL